MPNRLALASSPYLLQHAHNPVDWFEWGTEAFEKAEKEDKPIFLSVGYSTCHWCHVMEHESFEDDEVAAYMNEHFVSIKVDREERPDVDHIYMTVCQTMTGSGGWPLSVFLTPSREPYYAGTYFPRDDRYARPGFLRVLRAMSDAWKTDRDKVLGIGGEMRRALNSAAENPRALGADTLDKAGSRFSATFDPVQGGFGAAPKFPMGHALSFLLRRAARTGNEQLAHMARHTLTAMYRGGIYDHVGFGFCRYSTDAQWLVPHFEKMLYDNALLLAAHADLYALTGSGEQERVMREIAAYVLRDLGDPGGAFYSAENADSEGEEGKFYVFTEHEFLKAVGPEYGAALAEYFGVTAAGNFEHGANVLHIAVDPAAWAAQHGFDERRAAGILEQARQRLYAARAQRVRPSLDDKVLTSWNGLMISALARAGAVLGDPELVHAAVRAAEFILRVLRRDDGTLLHRWRAGSAGIDGFLEDYAFLALGLLDLYDATFDAAHLATAKSILDRMLADFSDGAGDGLFFTARNAEQLISRSKDVYDGAMPSGNSAAAYALARLGRLLGDTRYEDRARAIIETFGTQADEYPTGHTLLLTALDFLTGAPREIVIASHDRHSARPYIEAVQQLLLPGTIALLHETGSAGDSIRALVPFIAAQSPLGDRATVYVCERFECRQPVQDLESFITLLR